ncbi:MAG TPA: M64 family metallopeptidase, partial [Ignavibacteriales bacterium]|nr:M64 family metallopeptidase [Ignavibacteriales bacterium]
MRFSNIMLVWSIAATIIMGHPAMNFNDYFEDKTLRIDYYHIGDSKEEFVTIDKLYKYGIWAGSRKNLIDNFNNGRYYYKIYDASSGKLIYSKGFDSYFGEYKTSEEGLNGIKRTYHESAIIPAPKNKIKFALELRNDKDKKLSEVYSYEIDPSSMYIIKEEPADKEIKVYEVVKSGDPHAKVDIVILSEGYTAQEQAKFESDLKKFANTHFNMEPYKSYKNSFNIWGVFKPSMQSGADEPSHASFKNTVLGSTFNSLGSERYLLTEDNKTMRDMAAHVPYDAIYIMVNHKRYGGGGIYNLFCTFTADNQWQDYLFLHEFGHSFAGLADEYYTSDISYNEFYPHGIEPNEPNITALLDSTNIKWKELVSAGIELPTPWEKEEFDKMDYAFQEWRRMQNAKIAQLKVNGAPEK